MPELSIIVPVYNVGQYLEKCLNSIQNQIFHDFEVILIDDGSTDRSGIICDAYAEKDKRFIVIHQENKGVSTARNVGLEVAGGKYLGFIDADDWIDPNMYERLILLANEKQCDVVICGLNYFSEKEEFLRYSSRYTSEWNSDELIVDLYGSPSKIAGVCYNKIFRRDKIKYVRFDSSLRMAEDIVFLFRCFECIDSGYQVSDCYYNVLEREDSSTRIDKIDAMYKIVIQGKKTMMNYAMHRSDDLKKTAAVKYMDDCIRYSNMIKKEGKSNNLPYLDKFLTLRTEVIKLIPYFWITGIITNKNAKRFLVESITDF